MLLIFWHDSAKAIAHLFRPSSSILCRTLKSSLCGDCGTQPIKSLRNSARKGETRDLLCEAKLTATGWRLQNILPKHERCQRFTNQDPLS
eukprot:s1836_g2.t1